MTATLSNAAYSSHISRASPNAASHLVPQLSTTNQYTDAQPLVYYPTGVVSAFEHYQPNEAPYEISYGQLDTVHGYPEQPVYATSSLSVWNTPNNLEVPAREGESNVGDVFLSQQAAALGQNIDVSIASLEPSELDPRLMQLHDSQQNLSNTDADFSMLQPSIHIDLPPPLYDLMEKFVEPWSNVNMRTNAQHLMPPSYGTDAPSGPSLPASLYQTNEGYGYLPPNHNLVGTQANFDSDVDKAIAEQSIGRTYVGEDPVSMGHMPQQTTSLPYTSDSGLPEHTIGFWARQHMPSLTTETEANHNERNTLV
jgi:hypothetical protein